ncbi:CHAT domain-containing protein [Sphaerisporangium sp. NPDC088356]|uniref:CHAT domain-containing protein n=1 Tax=Sphaerisporangium sp. NPDC088356 TaxID=3154871 RepID=UPI00343E431B
MAELVAAAEDAVLMSGADPARARERARAVLAEAEAGGCLEAVSVAHRALALAAREFGHLTLAAEHLGRAVEAARDLPERAAQARLSLVTVRADLGDPVGALRVADLAEGHLTGLDPARLGVQRAVALVQLGRLEEAVANCDRAVARLTGAGDPRFLAGALLNRGIAHTYLELYDAASRDLSACVTTARRAGLDHLAILAEANLPFVATRKGDIPAAFAGYRAAEKALSGYPERLAAMRADFAGALLAAHLPGEARALLGLAVPDLAAASAQVALAESRLLLAQVELLVGDPYQARATAELAAGELTGQGRHAWVPLAAETALRARLAVERPTPELLAEARALAGLLAQEGWAGPAAGLRLTAAELAVGLSDRTAADAELGLVTAGQPAEGRTHRVVRHHAVALERSLLGDRPGAFASLREGLAEATEGSERLGDPGVRAHAVRAGERLADFGLSLALADGRPETVLGWAEHWRAMARGRSREPLAVERLRAALGDAVLIETVRHGDRLAAVVVTGERCVLRPLGSYTAAAEATIRLRYGLRRARLRDTGTRSGVAREAERLAVRLLGPLAGDIGDRPAIIVPTGALHTLPWPVLPPFRGRALCVASSANAWLTAPLSHPDPSRAATPSHLEPGDAATSSYPATGRAAAPSRPDAAHGVRTSCSRVAAVAGPGLEHAGAEAAMVVRTHQGASGVAVRVGAGSSDVVEALGVSDIVHIAAHGTFCARSPLLSSIALDDGPLMAYDLLRLRRTPELVVLSACDAGMAHAPVDGAPLGLAGAFLDQGTTCVVAGLVPVRDDEALTLMTLFHALLVSGRTPAEALAMASEKTGVQGFACFGSLGRPIGPPEG